MLKLFVILYPEISSYRTLTIRNVFFLCVTVFVFVFFEQTKWQKGNMPSRNTDNGGTVDVSCFNSHIEPS